MKRFWFIIGLTLLFSLLLSACQMQSPAQTGNEKPVVFVSILPQKYFVERIAGDSLQVVVMVEPGAEPHTYEPKPAQMQTLAEADLYFSIDAPFETTWLNRIAELNPDMKVINTAAGITKRLLLEHDHEEEDSEEAHAEEEASEQDPHIWLSPRLVILQAQQIHAALIAHYPQQSASYTENLNDFLADIEALDENLKATLGNLRSNSFIVYHPSWGYFADDYGLVEIAVEIGGTEPSASELAALIDLAKAEDIHVIFAQPEFNVRSAETLAEEIDGQVILISPLAENWLDNLSEVGTALSLGLK